MLQALAGQAWQIVDARSEEEHCGIDQGEHRHGGAIPGAVNLEWRSVVDQDTYRYLPADQLQALFDQAGIDLDRPSATHCASGGRAAVMVFAMELMGSDDVRNYYKGWTEWGNRDDTPIALAPHRPRVGGSPGLATTAGRPHLAPSLPTDPASVEARFGNYGRSPAPCPFAPHRPDAHAWLPPLDLAEMQRCWLSNLASTGAGPVGCGRRSGIRNRAGHLATERKSAHENL